MSTDFRHPEPLDPSLYSITEDEANFLKECTGITDDEELKQHILTVQAEAYAVWTDYYRLLSLTEGAPLVALWLLVMHHVPSYLAYDTKSSKLPGNSAYPAVLNLGKTRENAIMLDIGCGFGNDSTRAIADGFPLENVICTDLRKEYFNIGHKLYKTTPENYPLAFFEGDIFDTEFTYPESTTIPKLSELKNLGQLKGQISVIHASAFFHVFEEEKQRKLAHILAQLLSPQPGSIILGCQGGARTRTVLTTMFNPETWKDIWIGKDGPFNPDDVEVHAHELPPTADEMRAFSHLSGADGHFWLSWSILRK